VTTPTQLGRVAPVTVDITGSFSGDDVDWDGGGYGGAASGPFELNIEGGQSVIEAHGSMGSTETFDPTDGNVHTGTLTADCTVTLNAPTGTGAATLELWLTEDGTGGWTVAWPGSVTEEGTHDTTLGTTSRVILETIDGGTSWIATWIGGSSGTALTVQDEGTPLTTAADTLNFVGAGVVASGTGSTKTITIAGATVDAATIAALGFVGPILIADSPSTPLVFADLLQNDAQDDLMYADL
jgi:hypothetical protein